MALEIAGLPRGPRHLRRTSYALPARSGAFCSVIRLADEIWAGGSRFHRSGPGSHLLGCITAGSCRVGQEGHPAGSGCVLLLDGAEDVVVEVERDLALHLVVGLGAGFERQLALHLGARTGIHPVTDPGRISSLLSHMLRVAGSRADWAAEVLDPLLLALPGLVRSLRREALPSASLRLYRRCEELIRRDASRLRTVAAAAAACGIDASYLARLFREHGGQTPKAFLLRCRLDTVAQALAGGERTLDQLAASVGFSDGYALARAFTRTFGLPPGRYRRLHQGGSG